MAKQVNKKNNSKSASIDPDSIKIRTFESEEDLQTTIGLIETELSEPYPIYTYRYFV